MFISPPRGAEFSEFWLLNEENKMEDYPFSVTPNSTGTYQVRVGVRNHIGFSQHYLIYVKFKNQSDALPNATIGKPSPLPPLSEYRFFLTDNGEWETLVTFSFPQVYMQNGNYCQVGSIELDDQIFLVGKTTTWDSLNKGFFYQMFFELWLYNLTSQQF
jgi:hypothetical protein